MSTWHTRISGISPKMYVNSRGEVVLGGHTSGQVVLRGHRPSSSNSVIRLVETETGKTLVDIPSTCGHSCCPIIEHPVNPDFILEACSECEVIRSYDINTAESKTIYAGYKALMLCKGPEGYMFAADRQGELLLLLWREEKEELVVAEKIQIQTDMQYVRRICYIERSKILVITSHHNIKAINPETGSIRWEFTQDVDDRELDPRGVSYDLDGRVYVADGTNGSIMVLKGETGQLIQVHCMDESMGWLYDVCWTKDPPQLYVHHGDPYVVSTYNITKC